MKRTLLMNTLLAGGLAATAATYPYLTIERQDGSKLSIAVDGLTITYTSSSLIAGSNTISLADLSRMYFSTTDETSANAIESVSTAEVSATAEVYDLSGRRMPSTSSLPKGIYIIKQNGTTKKVQVK